MAADEVAVVGRASRIWFNLLGWIAGAILLF